MAYAALLLLSLLIAIAAGCLYPGQPVSAPVNHTSGPGANYLMQNVVTGSAGMPDGTDPDRVLPEDRMAVAIREAMDSRNLVTRDFAVSLIPQKHGGVFRISQVCDLWEAVYARWTYVDDPQGSDYVSPASRTITLGFKGDCDDFAIVVAAMLGSVGGTTRIVSAQNATGGHAYPEVYVGSTPEEFGKAAAYIRQRYQVADVGCHVTYHDNVPQYWLNLDWWSRHPGGQFFADDGKRIAYYPDGHWELAETKV
jgi:hypothetical protein